MTRRTEKVADLIQSTVAELLSRRVKDPVLSETMLSIVNVDVAPDLTSARVRVSLIDDEADSQAVLGALERTEPFLHREMGKILHMRRVPRLRFQMDTSIAEGDRITALLREVARDEGRDL
ncbi:MAG: 30S ribosome-binding factor RbfA [Dehalococcoidia bacterium]|nr:30S ribosome-binding factor RbfA [Dehalococcoidia bacterium]